VLFLTSSSDKIYVTTGANIPYDFQGSYIDWNGSVFTLGRVNLTIPSGPQTNTDVIAAPPAGVQRHVQRLTIRNTHASNRGSAIFYHTDGTTDIPLWNVSFNAGNTAQYSDSRGWEQFSTPYGGVVNVNYGVWTFYPANAGAFSDTANWRTYGINAPFTPLYSTRVYITLDGHLSNVAANVELNNFLGYGIGTPPATNTILPGGTVGISPNIIYLGNASSGGLYFPFTLTGLITGLTIGTAYWVDLLVVPSSGTQTVQNISCLIMEI
jgi:hypothetical protein